MSVCLKDGIGIALSWGVSQVIGEQCSGKDSEYRPGYEHLPQSERPMRDVRCTEAATVRVRWTLACCDRHAKRHVDSPSVVRIEVMA